MRHDDESRERLALAWHAFGIWISAASLVLAVGGIGWHLWATHEHSRRLRELRNPECSS
jgi:hypothetical protein